MLQFSISSNHPFLTGETVQTPLQPDTFRAIANLPPGQSFADLLSDLPPDITDYRQPIDTETPPSGPVLDLDALLGQLDSALDGLISPAEPAAIASVDSKVSVATDSADPAISPRRQGDATDSPQPVPTPDMPVRVRTIPFPTPEQQSDTTNLTERVSLVPSDPVADPSFTLHGDNLPIHSKGMPRRQADYVTLPDGAPKSFTPHLPGSGIPTPSAKISTALATSDAPVSLASEPHGAMMMPMMRQNPVQGVRSGGDAASDADPKIESRVESPTVRQGFSASPNRTAEPWPEVTNGLTSSRPNIGPAEANPAPAPVKGRIAPTPVASVTQVAVAPFPAAPASMIREGKDAPEPSRVSSAKSGVMRQASLAQSTAIAASPPMPAERQEISVNFEEAPHTRPAVETQFAQRGFNENALARPDLPRAVSRQIVEALRMSATRQAEIHLNPAELGRVKISLQTTDGAVMVHIMADRVETIDLMRRNIDLLAQDFRENGLGSTTFAFSEQRSDGCGGTTAAREKSSGRPSGQEPISAVVQDAIVLHMGERIDIRI